jgi:hypothetical protein
LLLGGKERGEREEQNPSINWKKRGRIGWDLEAERRRGVAGSSSAWQPAGEDDTVAGRKSRLFRLRFSLLGLTEREGDQTDFGEREGRLGWADWAGLAARGKRRVGPKSAQRLRERFKNFFQLK